MDISKLILEFDKVDSVLKGDKDAKPPVLSILAERVQAYCPLTQVELLREKPEDILNTPEQYLAFSSLIDEISIAYLLAGTKGFSPVLSSRTSAKFHDPRAISAQIPTLNRVIPTLKEDNFV